MVWLLKVNILVVQLELQAVIRCSKPIETIRRNLIILNLSIVFFFSISFNCLEFSFLLKSKKPVNDSIFYFRKIT